MFFWRAPGVHHRDGPPAAARGGQSWGFTRADADEGVSTGDFGRFNLGGHVGDDPDAVETNRRRLAEAVGVARSHLLFMEQCHGAEVAVADGPWAGPAPRVDAVVSDTPGLALAVLVADCTPILLADPRAGVIGAVHAGRPGLAAGIVDAAVTAARDLGATALRAAVGPSICGRCYEVPAAMRAEVAQRHPESATVSWAGTPALDVAAGVVARLHALSVPLEWVPGCTRESPSLFSYRRSARTGRVAGVVIAEERHG
ncbi:MAG: peptidoglycan editing factor PgeF [Mobilicoccus sp.]|nr:peptidoglycan editing factor PgeF [Mobilicoccus sp.]